MSGSAATRSFETLWHYQVQLERYRGHFAVWFFWAHWDLHIGRNHCGRKATCEPLGREPCRKAGPLLLSLQHFFPGSLLCSNYTHTKKVSSGGSYSQAVWTQASQSCLVPGYPLFSNTSFDFKILVRPTFCLSNITYSPDPIS